MKREPSEQEILDSVERGEWRSVSSSERERARYVRYAKATFRRDRRVNIRVSGKDLEAIQKRALEEGLPYQTLISSLLHKYAAGRLREVVTEYGERSTAPNRPSSLDELLRFAIAHKRLIQVSYGGARRVGEPHDYGVMKGSPKLLIFQIGAGGSRQKEAGDWKLLDVSKIDTCLLLDETFPGSRQDASHRHHTWDEVYARVA